MPPKKGKIFFKIQKNLLLSIYSKSYSVKKKVLRDNVYYLNAVAKVNNFYFHNSRVDTYKIQSNIVVILI